MLLYCDDNDGEVLPQEERSPIAAAKYSAIAVAAYIDSHSSYLMFADSAFIGAHVFFDRRSKKNH